MARVTPVWPDYVVVDVPPRLLGESGQRAMLVTTRTNDDMTPIAVFIPYSHELPEVNTESFEAELENLVTDAIEDVRRYASDK